MLHSIYKNKKVFITGHTGFKGSWLALWLHQIGAEVAGYSLAPDSLSHFNLLNLPIKNYFHDILDEKSLEKAMTEFRPDIVFHLAAQPLVRDSYDDPVYTYSVNVIGSLKVYMAALKAGVQSVVSITTDKVYENKEMNIAYKESDELGGYDPYSSSKACVEILTSSFRRSFVMNNQMLVATARAGNVIGGGDWAKDRLIPDLVRNAAVKNKTPIRNPLSVRPWQHVLEPLNGYLLLGEKLLKNDIKFATSFNFGPDVSDSASVERIFQIAKSEWETIDMNLIPDTSGKHEANLLMLDNQKTKKELSWIPVWTCEEAVKKTIHWYKLYYENKQTNSIEDLKSFIAKN